MTITPEEKLMYEVMRAIYESGIPISFKGSMVLKAFLIEAGYAEDTRHTVDIDANWNSESQPTEKQMTESLQKAFDSHDINLDIQSYRQYGEGRSAGFEITDRVFRRVKDVVDLYYASKVIPFNRAGIEYMLRNSKRHIGNFDGFLHRPEDLKHAYEKFRFTGDIEKPPFEEVYRTVRTYIRSILPRERDMDLER